MRAKAQKEENKKIKLEQKKSKSKEKTKDKKKTPLSFPWWFKIIAYLLSFIFASVSVFFIIVKGISFGNERCTKWLTSVVISLFTSVLVTQPLQVFAITFVIVAIFRKANDSSDEEVDPEDNGGPIYLDERIGNIDEYLIKMEVLFFNNKNKFDKNFIKITKGKSLG